MYTLTRNPVSAAFLAMVLAVAASTSVNAHMEMCKPPPRGSKALPGVTNIDYDNKSPTTKICQGKPAGPIAGTYKAGGSIDVAFDGSAVHNGGHCQFSLSYDEGKTFVVIKDVLNNCLTGAKEYSVPVPATAPGSKKAIFAWSWINASGNREYYMNCADVVIEGPADGKVTGPQMLVANLAGTPTVPEWGTGVDNVGPKLLAGRKQITVTASGSTAADSGYGGGYGSGDKSPSAPTTSIPDSSTSTPTSTSSAPAYPTNPPAPETPDYPSNPPAAPSNEASSSTSATPAYPASSPATQPGSAYPDTQEPKTTTPSDAPTPDPAPAGSCKLGEYRCAGSTQFTVCAPSGPVTMSCAPGTVCVPDSQSGMRCDHPSSSGGPATGATPDANATTPAAPAAPSTYATGAASAASTTTAAATTSAAAAPTSAYGSKASTDTTPASTYGSEASTGAAPATTAPASAYGSEAANNTTPAYGNTADASTAAGGYGASADAADATTPSY